MVSSKGQVSIFVVVGAILILVVGFLFMNSKFDVLVPYDTKVTNTVGGVVDSCLEDVSSNGVFILGFQGGVIDIPNYKAADPRLHTKMGFKVPNWDGLTGDVPSVPSMEYELENYVFSNVLDCVDVNLKALSEIYDIEVSPNVSINAVINSANVIVDMSLPITVSEIGSDNVLKISDFSSKLDSKRLGDMFELALDIYSTEASDSFVENLVMDQIYSSSDYSSRDSMPSEGMGFSCNPRVWTIPQLKRNLAELNNQNFRYLYFDGTYPIDDKMDANFNDIFGTSDFREYFEKNYVFDLENSKRSFENYQVEVFMPSEKVTGEDGFLDSYSYRTFEVTPSEGQIVSSYDLKVDLGVGKIPVPCVQIFHYLYELDYDLIVRITDFNDDGNRFVFQFPLRVQIDSNLPKKDASSAFFIKGSDLTATNDKFCSEDSREYPLRVFAIDSSNDAILDDVDISYDCLSLSCDLGKTSKVLVNGFTTPRSPSFIEAEFPYCVGGDIVAEKDGYYRGKVKVDTTSDLLGADPIPFYNVYLTPTKDFKVDVSSFLVVWDGDGHRIKDEGDGQIYVTISNSEYDFSSQVIWPTEDGIMDTLSFLDIDDLAYNVSVMYTGSDFELRSIFDIKDWVPDIHSGNSVSIVIPAVSEPLGEDEFIEKYEFFNEVVTASGSDYGIEFE